MQNATYEEKIEFLKGYRKAKIEEMNFKIESEALINCKILSTPQITGMPKAHKNNKDLSELEQFIEERQQEYIGYRYIAVQRAAKINECINKLQDETEKTILLLRYIHLDSHNRMRDWKYIAGKTGYSRAAVHKHYKNALNNLEIPEKKIKE